MRESELSVQAKENEKRGKKRVEEGSRRNTETKDRRRSDAAEDGETKKEEKKEKKCSLSRVCVFVWRRGKARRHENNTRRVRECVREERDERSRSIGSSSSDEHLN